MRSLDIRSIHLAIRFGVVAAGSIWLGNQPASAQPMSHVKTLSIYEHPTTLPAQQPSGRVAILIRDLSSPSPATREAASRSLLEMCPKIEAQLEWAYLKEEESSPPNLPLAAPLRQKYSNGGALTRYQPAVTQPRVAYHELSALLERCLELRRAKPALITIDRENAPLFDILRELGQQVDADVFFSTQSFDGYVDPALLEWIKTTKETVHLAHVPYWNALRSILQGLHPPNTPGMVQFVSIGANRMELNVPSEGRHDPWSDSSAVSAGPLLLSSSWIEESPTQLTVRAMADPALQGTTGDSKLHLEEVTEDTGRSLLHKDQATVSSGGRDDADRDPKEGYTWDGHHGWRQVLPIDAPTPGHRIATIRGQFSIGVAPVHQHIGIPLARFDPPRLAEQPHEKQVFVLTDCQVLSPPSEDGPLYDETSLCRRKPLPRRRPGDPYTDVQELLFTNTYDEPVTFVVAKTLGGGTIPDSATKPDEVTADVAIYHLHAAPNETVPLHIEVRYIRGQRWVPAELPPTPESPIRAEEVADFDGWRLSVQSVTRTGSLYAIAGQLSLPADGPFSHAGAGPGYIYLSAADQQGWAIDHGVRFSKLRPQGDGLVEDFLVTTREPGRIPSSLIWDTPEATHWITQDFELH